MEENPSVTPSPLAPHPHKEFFIIGSIFTLLMLVVAAFLLYPEKSVAPKSETSVEDTIQYLYDIEGNKTFAKDSKHIYFIVDQEGTIGGILAPDDASAGEAYKREVDYNTFEVIGPHGIYSKDKNYVYYSTDMYFTIVKDADPLTFSYDHNTGIAKDASRVWIISGGSSSLEGADPSTFIKVNEWWYKDKNHVFFEGSRNQAGVLAHADPSTFVPLLVNGEPTIYGTNSSRDKIFCPAENDIMNVDLATFQVLTPWSAKDKNHTYNQCETYDPNNP